MTTPRALAKQWRAAQKRGDQFACAAIRLKLDALPEVTWRDGIPHARCDWAAISASGGGAYRPVTLRRENEQYAAGCTFDGDKLLLVDARMLRELGRRAA